VGGVNFSASTTHALRAMAWLAAHVDGEAVLGRDLARKLKIQIGRASCRERV